MKELGIDQAKVNVHAVQWPWASYRRKRSKVLTTLLYAMKDRNVKRGLATLCLVEEKRLHWW